MSVESMAAFARRLGVARSTVTRWAKSGRIELTPNGKVRVEESIKLLEQLHGARPDVAARHAKKRAKQPKTTSKPTQKQGFEGAENYDFEKNGGTPLLEGSGLGAEDALAFYKAQALDYKNRLTKLELALERGEWLKREAHNRAMGELGKRLRQGLENLADALAPRMAAGLVDGAAIEAEIQQTIEEVLGA